MKSLLLVLFAAIALPSVAQSSHYVKPHTRSDGTYVEGHRATNPDSSRNNNYSTQGNYNPYTGKQGTVDPYAQPAPRYDSQPRQRNPYGYKY